jgi:hypothetical protein
MEEVELLQMAAFKLHEAATRLTKLAHSARTRATRDRLLAVAHELDRQARRLAAGADDDSAARPGRKSIAGRVPAVRRISRNAPSGGRRSGASL